MAWERRFEAKVHELRQRELKYQRLSYHVQMRDTDFQLLSNNNKGHRQLFFNTIWYVSLLMTGSLDDAILAASGARRQF